MKNLPQLRTRRDFLRTTVLGGALSYTVPAFLANTFAALQADAANSAIQTATGKDSTILVVLQMAGGNDGINTVVPYSSDFYHKARPRIHIAPKDVLKINDEIGLNPGMTGFKSLYDAGQLSVVQGVGYPNPNRSHFRSTEIWQTASDSNKVEKYGWIGRYFDNACQGADPTVGVSIGDQMPQSFSAPTPMGISLANAQRYRYMGNRADDQSFRELTQTEHEDPSMMASSDDNSGASISSLRGPTAHKGNVMDFLERTALDAEVSSDKIMAITKGIQNQATYPASPLANSLKLVSKLIAGGLPTRIFYVSQGGYDTHVNQVTQQNRLLKDLGDSVKAFVDDLKAQGNFQRVVIMTFSEFGRRVAENANGGTDHGAAAPMFVIGPKVKAGLHGIYPSLAPTDLFQGDIKYNVDFRTVYAGLLEEWLKTRSAPILGRQFKPLPLV